MDKYGFMSYMKEEFPSAMDMHFTYDLVESVVDYASLTFFGHDIIKFLMNIIPEVTYEEYLPFVYMD